MGIKDPDRYRTGGRRQRFGRSRYSRGYSVWAITLAIVATGALLLAVLAWILHSRAEAAAELALRSTPNVLQQSQIEGQKLQREGEDREATRQSRVQQQEARRLQAITDQQRATEEAQRAEAEAVDRKAKAWEKFYRKPAVCNDATTMACANAFIRAKRVFEEKYGRGEL